MRKVSPYLLLRALVASLVPSISFAQWMPTNGSWNNVDCIVVSSVGKAEPIIFAGTAGCGIFRSSDNGATWTNADSGLTDFNVSCLTVEGTNLFAGTGGGVFVSTDSGTFWTAVNSGLLWDSGVNALVVNGTDLFAGTQAHGIFRSTNNGASWTAVDSGFPGYPVYSLAVSGRNVFAGTNGGIFLSADNGTSWTAVDSGVTNLRVWSLAATDSGVFAGTYRGISLSTNNGASWVAVDSGLSNLDLDVRTVAAFPDSKGGVDVFAASSNNGNVFRSTDFGRTWARSDSGLTDPGQTNSYVHAFAFSGTNLLAGRYGNGIFLSTNSGVSWKDVNAGMMNLYVETLVSSGTNLFAGTYRGGVFLSTDNGASWTAVNSGLTCPGVLTLAVSGNRIFAGTDSAGVFVSTNSGASWSAIDSGLTCSYVTDIISSSSGTGDTVLIAATAGGGVYLSTNNGTQWKAINSGLGSLEVWSVASIGRFILASTWAYGVFRSSDEGTSWLPTNYGFTRQHVIGLAFSSDDTGRVYAFAGTQSGGAFVSSDYGNSWKTVNNGLTNTYVRDFIVLDGNIFAGTNGGVFLSADDGALWTPVSPEWNASVIATSPTDLFVGTWGNGVWKRPLSEMTTDIATQTGHVPEGFYLSQNYPNPFNPSTIVSYQLPMKSQVTLQVYDVLGRLVKTLVNEKQTVGSHQVVFNASGLPSGVYFYTIRAGSFVKTLKLVVLK